MTKKQRAKEIVERLEKEYPLAACSLDYDEAWNSSQELDAETVEECKTELC